MMPLWLRLVVLLAALAGAAGAVWVYMHQPKLAGQWDSYRVGQAADFAAAEVEIARFERAPDPRPALRELCGKWGTGNQRFDLYLAEHVRAAGSTEALRQEFSLVFAWREDLLARWAHYWTWRVRGGPVRRIAAVVEYFDLLATADPPRAITWREVLDLQAVFQLTGQPKLAVRLTPENWRERYRRWQQLRPETPPRAERPAMPFPDWQGPPPGDALLAAERRGENGG